MTAATKATNTVGNSPPHPLRDSRLTYYIIYINYMSSIVRIIREGQARAFGSRAVREVGGRRAVTALRRCSMRNVTRGSCWRHRGEPCRGGGQRVCRDADEGRFRRLQYGRASRHEGGHHRHSDDKGLRARGVGPDGPRSDVDRVGRPISMESTDPQLSGMATDGITDAAYQATYRTCMRRNGF
jgi:hypothetical protein